MVRPKGTLSVIHRADRLDALLAALAGRLGGTIVYPLWPGPGAKPAKRVVVRGRLRDSRDHETVAGPGAARTGMEATRTMPRRCSAMPVPLSYKAAALTSGPRRADDVDHGIFGQPHAQAYRAFPRSTAGGQRPQAFRDHRPPGTLEKGGSASPARPPSSSAPSRQEGSAPWPCPSTRREARPCRLP